MLRWIKIDVMIEGEQKPPFFVGSMLRGAIGFALKRVVCINPSFQCEGCFSAKECLYYRFYEEQHTSHAFRLDIRLQPKNFDFSLYLFDEAVDALPYILSAVKKAVEENGLGKDRKKMRVRQISIRDRIIYDGNTFASLDGVEPVQLLPRDAVKDVRVEFTMPLRIKEKNKLATEEISLHTLIHSIRNRYAQIKGDSPSRLDYHVEGEIVSSTLKYVDMHRYSNRQKKGMSLGGLKGTLTIKGLDPKSYEYLRLGEITAAGKQTAFGLGSYILKEEK